MNSRHSVLIFRFSFAAKLFCLSFLNKSVLSTYFCDVRDWKLSSVSGESLLTCVSVLGFTPGYAIFPQLAPVGFFFFFFPSPFWSQTDKFCLTAPPSEKNPAGYARSCEERDTVRARDEDKRVKRHSQAVRQLQRKDTAAPQRAPPVSETQKISGI